MPISADIVIVGGGATALLRRSRPSLKVTLVKPSEHHFYQPA